jgi:hypothetical protein
MQISRWQHSAKTIGSLPLGGASFLARAEGLFELAIDEEVARYPTGAPCNIVGPSLNATCILVVDEYVATLDECLAFTSVWAYGRRAIRCSSPLKQASKRMSPSTLFWTSPSKVGLKGLAPFALILAGREIQLGGRWDQTPMDRKVDSRFNIRRRLSGSRCNEARATAGFLVVIP